MYATYVVTHYPHITSLGYLHTSNGTLPSYVLPPYYSNEMIEYRRKIMNRISIETKNKKSYND